MRAAERNYRVTRGTELAAKSLLLMRNETIIKAIIEKARTGTDEESKGPAIFALKIMMKEDCKSLRASHSFGLGLDLSKKRGHHFRRFLEGF